MGMEDGDTVGFECSYGVIIQMIYAFLTFCTEVREKLSLWFNVFFIMHNETALPSERPQEKLS